MDFKIIKIFNKINFKINNKLCFNNKIICSNIKIITNNKISYNNNNKICINNRITHNKICFNNRITIFSRIKLKATIHSKIYD